MGMTQPVRSSLVTVDPVPRRTASLCLVLIRPTLYLYSLLNRMNSYSCIIDAWNPNISIPKSYSEYLTTLEYKL